MKGSAATVLGRVVSRFSFVLLIAGLFLFWPSILVGIFPQLQVSLMPTPVDLIPGILAWLILQKIRCPYSRMLGYVWILWYFVGTLNTLSSSLVLGNYYSNLYLRDATGIYLMACVFYFLGLLGFERFFGKNKYAIYSGVTPKLNIHPFFRWLLLIFPLLWLLSMYLKLGYIPILSGVDITDDLYQIAYGPLYPYGACLVISILYAGQRSMSSKTSKERLTYALVTALYLLISLADGKRAFAMVAIGGLIAISFRLLHEKTWTKILPMLAITMVALYVGGILIRGGGTADTSQIYLKFMLVGVEFRDFVYSVNFIEPGKVENYSWATSTLASMTNSVIFPILGLDKGAIVSLDSAHAWAALWGSSFGIRTGVVSELWFAYGIMSMLILFSFGLLSGYIIKTIRTTAGIKELIFMAAIFGLLFLAITSQSTFTAGTLPVFLYLYLVLTVGQYLMAPRKVILAPNV